jgi:uncharacterized protein (TIGR03435 family)
MFEVASVKLNKSGEQPFHLDVQPGGRFTAINTSLRQLVSVAYPSDGGKFRNEENLVGGPDWFNTDRFDIVAKAEGTGALDTNGPAEAATPADLAAVERVRAMLRNLLADRFHLTLHHETREVPVFALVMAKSDRTLGPQLRRSVVDCAALRQGGRANVPLGPNQAPCGGVRMLAPGKAVAQAISMGILLDMMRGWVGRTVVDRTAITGKVDMTLNWTADQGAAGTPEQGASIFTAVQEQLGLKLESDRGSIDVMVVDHAERPTAD